MTVRLTQRGPNATSPAKLPGLQTARLADPQAQKAIEALREWVEVRLGSRGDKYEKAVTLREFEQRLKTTFDKVDELKNFTGAINTLTADIFEAIPTNFPPGAFAQVNDDLYYCNGKTWKQVTLT